jgi:hypothetical protein
MSKALIIYDPDSEAARRCARLLHRLHYSDLVGIGDKRRVEMMRYSVIVFISTIRDGRVSYSRSFLDYWDDLRYKPVIMVLAGSAPADHPIYSQVYENEIPPSIREHLIFFKISAPASKGYLRRLLEMLPVGSDPAVESQLRPVSSCIRAYL